MWFPKRFTPTPRAPRKPARRRLTVEALEDRCLPASGLSAALVADIVPGGVGSNPANLVVVKNTLFFVADDGAHGPELWKSDATAGTVLVKDINPSGGSNPAHMTAVGGTLYFSADDGSHGRELWKSDGTAAGTVLVKDINPDSGSSMSIYGVKILADVNGTLFFSAYDGVHSELWKSDGTEAGTVLVKEINAGTVLVNDLTNLGGTLYFSASTATYGAPALWKSDGTAAGTVVVKDISPGPMTNVNGTLFFGASGGTLGNGLWKSDGTTAGTVFVKSVGVANLTNVNGTLFFAGADANGSELWKSDGTSTGTVLVKDIFTGKGGSFVSIGGEACHGRCGSGTSSPASSEPADLTNVNGRLYFVATNGYTGKGNGRELWTSDGTAAGTVLVKDIVPGSGSSLPDNLTNVNGLLYFTAADGVVHGYELWQSDGTAAGTVMVQDINPGSGGSNPTYLVAMNNKLYFSADDGTHGRELWDPPPVEPSGGSSRLGGGDTSALAGFDVRIADLGGTTLGLASGNTLWLDDAAAGWGWFVDETPGEDSEFTTPGKQGEMHRMDLLTVLMHEIGHVLGYEHSKEGVMAGSLTAGTRHVPPSGPDLFDVAVLDQVFADGKTSLALPFSDGAVL